MACSICFCHSPLAFKTIKPCDTDGKAQKLPFLIRSNGAQLCNQRIVRSRVNLSGDWSFIGGSRVILKPKVAKFVHDRKISPVHALWLVGSQLASSVFTLGTIAVLPFYTLMVLAPKSKLTKKSMQSSLPYVVLGVLYAYLLYLSWTPETMRLIFASKYWLPEVHIHLGFGSFNIVAGKLVALGESRLLIFSSMLTSIGRMFSNEMTLASAWIHLLVVDLFAARHVFHDGLENEIETRHSVSLCLFFCPIGILTHIITKAIAKPTRQTEHAHRGH